MKKNEKKVLKPKPAINPTDQFKEGVEAFYTKLGVSPKNIDASIEFSLFDKVDVSYSSCAGV